MSKSLFATLAILFVFGLSVILAPSAQAQFSKPVVLLKGCVFTTDGKPATVRLSIHETGDAVDDEDTSHETNTCGITEITASKANSESGHYVLILKPGKKYWVHLEGTFLQTVDTLLTMPKSDKPQTIEQNFVVNWRQQQDASAPAENPQAKKE